MSDYIEDFKECVINEKRIDKFDALMSILTQRVYDSVYTETSDQCAEISQQLDVMFRSIKLPKRVFDGEYNATVNMADLTDLEKAYFKGELAALCNIVNITTHKRPTQKQLSYGMDNVAVLKEIENDPILYDSTLHYDLYVNGLIDYYRHGKVLYCTLSPFGKDVIMKHKIMELKNG